VLELLLAASLTVLPDYLYRRYGQGKRIGREITLFSVWYQLRWGITGCLMLTIALLTTIFYFHPSTTNAASFFRTIAVLPETPGRVAEVYVGLREEVEAGTPLFRLDSASQQAAVESARRRVAEVEAATVVAESELATSGARIAEARSGYMLALDELETKTELRNRNTDLVPLRDIERLQNALDGRQAALDAALAGRATLETQIASLLPAQKSTAEAALTQAESELAKTTVYAGVGGRLEQFTLRVGDIVNPFMRPAGILIPRASGRTSIEAGFGQIEAQVIRPGMIAEAVCISRPYTIIPLVVTEVQDVIATGQIRPSEQLVDLAEVTRPGTITAYLEPLFASGLDGVPPGSNCIVNAYSNHHEALADPSLSPLRALALHGVDAVGVVHASLLRVQALLMPIRALVLSGGH
jgi:multidrug resistance efflux pump